jgi:hypothetical protein
MLATPSTHVFYRCRWDWCAFVSQTQNENYEHFILKHEIPLVPMTRREAATLDALTASVTSEATDDSMRAYRAGSTLPNHQLITKQYSIPRQIMQCLNPREPNHHDLFSYTSIQIISASQSTSSSTATTSIFEPSCCIPTFFKLSIHDISSTTT